MLPLTVSFETVLQIFNNNFKQEEVKVSLFPPVKKYKHSSSVPHPSIEGSAACLSVCVYVCLRPTFLSNTLVRCSLIK